MANSMPHVKVVTEFTGANRGILMLVQIFKMLHRGSSKSVSLADSYCREFEPSESPLYSTIRVRAVEQFNHIWEVTKLMEQKANWLFVASSGSCAWTLIHREEFKSPEWMLTCLLLPAISVCMSAVAFLPGGRTLDNLPKVSLDLVREYPNATVDGYITASINAAIEANCFVLEFKSWCMRWSTFMLGSGVLVIAARLAWLMS
jgi:hypothetical protein